MTKSIPRCIPDDATVVAMTIMVCSLAIIFLQSYDDWNTQACAVIYLHILLLQVLLFSRPIFRQVVYLCKDGVCKFEIKTLFLDQEQEDQLRPVHFTTATPDLLRIIL